MKTAFLINSGGLDSVAAMYYYHKKGFKVINIHFDYGQQTFKKTKKDLKFHSSKLNQKLHILKLSYIPSLMDTSKAWVEKVSKASKESAYIPHLIGFLFMASLQFILIKYKNLPSIFIILATQYSSVQIKETITTRNKVLKSDCSIEYLNLLERLAQIGSVNSRVKLLTPFLHLDKIDVINIANKFSISSSRVSSCESYPPCGKCWKCEHNKTYLTN